MSGLTSKAHGYSVKDLTDAIISVRSSENPRFLEICANKWLKLGGDAVVAAIAENGHTPYRVIEKIVKKRMSSIEIMRICYKHPNITPELVEKIEPVLNKNKEVYYQTYLPSYGRGS